MLKHADVERSTETEIGWSSSVGHWPPEISPPHWSARSVECWYGQTANFCTDQSCDRDDSVRFGRPADVLLPMGIRAGMHCIGAPAATANGNLRWFAVVLIGVSAATSIRIARDEEKARLNALEAIHKNGELNEQPTNPQEPVRKN